MTLVERRWCRELSKIGRRLAEQMSCETGTGVRLLKMALAWRLLADVGLPVKAPDWPRRWETARAWGGEIFSCPTEWSSEPQACSATLDSLIAMPIPVPIEHSLSLVHQMGLDCQGEGRHRARKAMGSYYTPPTIVDQLLEASLGVWIDGWKRRWLASCESEKALLRAELADLRIMDPACGAGAFLLPAWERLVSCWQMVGDEHPARSALQNISGWEQDQGAIEILRVVLAARLYARGEYEPGFALGITLGDYLQHAPTPDEQVALVVGNPPWVRAKYALGSTAGEGKVRLAALRTQFSELAVGELNLYTLFISRALDWLLPGGRLAFITPNSFLLDRNSEGLRRRIIQESRVLGLIPLTERDGRRLFGGVSQATVMLTLQRVSAAQSGVSETQSHWSDLPHALMVSGLPSEIRLVHRLLRYPPLADHFDVQDGELHLTRGKQWIACGHGEELLPLLRGSDIAAGRETGCCCVRLSGQLMKRWGGLIRSRRILLQRIANQHLRRRLKGAIVQGVVAANSTVALIPKDAVAERLLPETLRLLHSNLYHWLLMKLSSDNNIPAWKLKLLPWLPPTTLQAKTDTSTLNQCVYDLFDLTEAERSLIEAAVGTAKNHAD